MTVADAEALAQAERSVWCCAVGCVDPINQRGLGLGHNPQVDLRSHGCRHRRTDDIPFYESLPFANLVNRMNHDQLILAVERFRYLAGGQVDRSEAIIGGIRARGIIDTNQCLNLVLGLAFSRFRMVKCG